MKSTFIFTLGIFLTFTGLQAQKYFEGTIVYKMEYDGVGVSAFSSMMPNASVFKFREKDLTYEIEGGMIASAMGKFLLKGETGNMYMVKEAEKRAYLFTESDMDSAAEKIGEKKPLVTDMNETLDILGYSCKKYKVVNQTNDGDMVQYLWATDKIKFYIPEGKDLEKASSMGQFALAQAGIEGFPLRIESEARMAGIDLTTLMIATEINKEKPDRANFTLGEDFEVEPFDPQAMMRR